MASKKSAEHEDWSPLRRNVEAFRQLEELRRAPASLTIPESLVRRTLAGVYGCEPEDITWDQIRNGVAGLLVDFPTISVTTSASPPPQASAILEESSRVMSVMPLLEAKGWSILDWALEAEVSHATAIDYLNGKTKPYRSTRLKLAKALGMAPDKLPR